MINSYFFFIYMLIMLIPDTIKVWILFSLSLILCLHGGPVAPTCNSHTCIFIFVIASLSPGLFVCALEMMLESKLHMKEVSPRCNVASFQEHVSMAYLPSDPHLAGPTSTYTSNYPTSKTSLKTSVCGDTIPSSYFIIHGLLHLI